MIAVLYDVHGNLRALEAVLTAAAIAKLGEAYGDREWAPTILRRLETQRA